jgi:hypothetical protein
VVILEILEAIKLNYRKIQIYEIWHYEETDQYNPCDKKGGLFTEYVNNFLKIKQEASGFPEWVESEQDKLSYINDYKRNEGIFLDYNKIKPNSGLKALSNFIKFTMGPLCHKAIKQSVNLLLNHMNFLI